MRFLFFPLYGGIPLAMLAIYLRGACGVGTVIVATLLNSFSCLKCGSQVLGAG